jgi:hypothetical protein
LTAGDDQQKPLLREPRMDGTQVGHDQGGACGAQPYGHALPPATPSAPYPFAMLALIATAVYDTV